MALLNDKEVTLVDWSWKPEWSSTILSNGCLTAKDAGEGKAWTTSVALTPIPPGQGLYYYEIKVDFCNTSNSIKIVFGILTSLYLNNLLKREVGKMGSIKGGSPFGFFQQFGKGTLCYFANGQIYKDGAQIDKVEPFSNNDTIGMCVDTRTNSISFYKNHQLVGKSFTGIITQLFDTKSENDQSMHQDLYPAVSLIKDNIVSIVQKPNFLPPPSSSLSDSSATTSTTSTASTSTSSTTSTLISSPLAPPNVNIMPPPSPNNIPNNNSNTTTAAITTTTSTSTSSTTTTGLSPPSTSLGSTPKPPPTPPLTSDPGNSCPVCGISLISIGKDWVSVNKHIDECLTISLLDNEQGQKPFSITCPYPNCKKPNLISKDFVPHCNDSHFLENNHSYTCPLCNVNATNLISHLSKNHITLPSVKKESFVGVGYSTNILDHDLGDQECAVCLEEFYKGQSVARLECWCVFHVDCISAYLLKSKKCPVHT